MHVLVAYAIPASSRPAVPSTGRRRVARLVAAIVILTADSELVSPMEVLYLGAGLTMAGLGFAAARGGRRQRARP